MPRPFAFSGLRARLFLVVMLASLPALGLILYNANRQGNIAFEEAKRRALEVTDRAAAMQKSRVEDALRLLEVAAEIPDVLRGNSAQCASMLERLARPFPAVRGLSRINASGTMDCSTVLVPAGMSDMRTDPDYQAVIGSQRPSIGNYRRSRRSGKPIVEVSRPVREPSGRIAVLTAAVTLNDDLIDELAVSAKVSQGGVVSIWNFDGTLLARLPVGDSTFLQRSYADYPPFVQLRTLRRGTLDAKGLDGRMRLWAFAPLPSRVAAPAFVSVGLPYAVVYAERDRYVRLTLLGFVVIVGLAIWMAWWASQVLVLRDVRALLSATTRLADGDINARTGLPHYTGELGQLARAFDGMALRLAERQREYTALAKTTLDLISRHSPDLRFTYANPAMAAVVGQPVMWFEGRRLRDLDMSRDEVERWEESMRDVLRGAGVKTLDFHLPTPLGDRWFEAQIAPELNEDGAIVSVVAISRDVTQRRELESQLLQAQKMESVGQLAGGVAHDFNNLLTAIIGNTEIAIDELEEGHPARDDLRRVLDAAGRSSNLTRQLLAFSRRRMLSPRTLDLNTVIARTTDLLRPIIGEHVTVHTTPTTPLPSVTFDPAQLEQVIVNLAINARDAMPAGGDLRLGTLAEMVLAASPAHRRGVPPGYYAVLWVQDTGTGMSGEVRERIFEPFFTTKPPGRGTGLGLSMVYGTVRQHGGHLLVDSAPGEGSTFWLYLPALDAVVPASPTVPSGENIAITGGREQILLVEDETEVRTLASRVLRGRGYTVIEAINGEEALSMLHEGLLDHLDLLVTDLVMPKVGGAELIEMVRRVKPGLPVLLASGYSRAGVPEYLFGQPHTAFIEKPFDGATLLNAVRALADGVVPRPTGPLTP